ncbi:MAG: ATP-binding protein [Candidatus Methanoplasma sp.]|jgi:AAA+ ATPase superfamily predicted ATPase|nr:ATP-binding protein [Candidatus Methanoplasma sp.]
MEFYGRKVELEILEKNRAISEKGGFFTVIVGGRRVGKTSLVLKFLEGRRHAYLYVTRNTEAVLCEQFAVSAKMGLGISLFGNRFRDLFIQLMEHGIANPFTLVIDEFQEFLRVNPAIFGDVQEVWDKYKQRSKVNLVACGSLYAMMTKLFEDEREPLFGRSDSKLTLRPFKTSETKSILESHRPGFSGEDLLFLHAVTGGIPKYVGYLMDRDAFTAERMMDVLTSNGSIFLAEGKDVLVSEFGKEYGTFFSIMQTIAKGRNTQGEIDDVIGMITGAYLSRLEKDYSLISRSRPLFSESGSRNVRWQIVDPYMRFYFRFIHPNLQLIEMERFDFLKEVIAEGYPSYRGLVLEDYFKRKVSEEDGFTSIGGYWDRSGHNEIDIIALNDVNRRALVVEVKADPKKIDIAGLEKKARAVMGLAGYDTTFKGVSLDDM